METEHTNKTPDQQPCGCNVLAAVLKSIYFEKFTRNQEQVILNIIQDTELPTATMKANEICEFLGIEKRENRRAISSVLEANGC